MNSKNRGNEHPKAHVVRKKSFNFDENASNALMRIQNWKCHKAFQSQIARRSVAIEKV